MAQKYDKYKTNPTELEEDLQLCPLTFLGHDLDTLLGRIDSLVLRWVTFEEVLGLLPLISHNVPGNYKTNFRSWKEVFCKIGMESTYYDLLTGN